MHNGLARKNWIMWTAAVLCCLTACVPVTDDADPDARIEIDFNEPEQRRLYDLQDQLAVDSLVLYLDDPDPVMRYLAARAFGSVQYDSAVAPLTRLLLDPIDELRAMAAYALGQQGEARAQAALVQAFDARDTAGVYARANGQILEALGKVADTTLLDQLAGVSTYLPTDTLLALGQARAIYRFATRGTTSSLGTQVMLSRATDASWPTATRTIAAHYLQRANVSLAGYAQMLTQAIDQESDRGVRLALYRALGKTGEPQAIETLRTAFAKTSDALTRAEILLALGDLPYEQVRETLFAGARSRDALVATAAVASLGVAGQPEDASQYWRLAKDSVLTEASTGLYAAALKHMPPYLKDYRRYINLELKTRFGESRNDYERASLLHALAEYPWNYRYLIEQALQPNQSLVVSTAAAEGIDKIVRQPGSVDFFRGSFSAVKAEIATYLETVMDGNNAGLQAMAASTLAIPAWNFQTAYESLEFLRLAKASLTLPRDTETAYFIEEALAQLSSNYTAAKPTPRFNHPITWDIYRSLQPGLEVVMETPRGQIVIDLFEEAAPGTVVNFVQLVRTGFYNGKRFHRIVPGFVTQGGGPRGDGYGSLDYTLRTETPPLYYDAPGYVGMASAGRHTEGVQFFFTHQATPHLDGRYTIFGRVVEGMEVVEQLRRGDDMRLRLR